MIYGVLLGLLLAGVLRLVGAWAWRRWRAFGTVGEMKGRAYW